MTEFDPWSVSTREEAVREVAQRIEKMQKLYQEATLLANAFDIRIDIAFDLPDDAVGGHNGGLYGQWNPSSKYC